MRSRKLLWRLYPSYLLIILMSILATAWLAYNWQKNQIIQETANDLESRVKLARKALADSFNDPDDPDALSACVASGKETNTRLTLVLDSGRVICDSESDPLEMESHADRPEIKEALTDGLGVSIRHSGTLKTDFMYVAVPVEIGGKTVGVIRASIPLVNIDQILYGISHKIMAGGLVVALLAALVSFYVSSRISGSLSEIKSVADRFREGELERRLPRSGIAEIDGLSHAMNEMAVHLEDRIKTISDQRREQEAILSSMIEGVMAVDGDERIISMNDAAARILGLVGDDCVGRSIQETVRKRSLQKLVSETLDSDETVEGRVILGDENPRYIQVHGAPLRHSVTERHGAVLVMNDLTKLERLENMRRDFVANVSHELKTPITSIKGFVETLQDGALDSREDATRFLDIISRQVNRLNTIIDDLLLLSRLEREEEKGGIKRERGSMRKALEAAVELCSIKAGGKNISIELDCADNVTVEINEALFEQAVVNLIDNAIKYSEEGTTVKVRAQAGDSAVTVSVRDYGPGIEKEHLPRIFERFYRVDKARSRNMGGTGLGLAIVKHIATSHGGNVGVESAPGKGSVFSIYLPI